jgi:hypothetical protein
LKAQNNTTDHDNIHSKVEDGLDFILSHFQEPLFPRKIMTRQLGHQLEVFNKEEVLEYFKSSNYEDSRINACPSFTEYHGINRTPISFLMVDLDLKDFVDEEGSKIEKLLQTPIDDYRKNAINLILAPYLINIKKASYDDALNIINSWLSKCGELRQLDQNFDYTVRYALKNSVKNGHRPLKFDTLKLKNKVLYDLLT